LIAYLENSLVRRTLFHFVAAVSMVAASMVSASFGAVVGVDFGPGTSIPNWTNISSAGTYTNLNDENGVGSGINLAITSTILSFAAIPTASTVPQPFPSIATSLSGIDGVVYDFGGTFNAQYTGLTPGRAYSFWLFGLRAGNFGLAQFVTITTDSVVLSYQQTASPNQLMINSQVGSSSFNLGHYADTVIASSTGTISINVVGNGESGEPFTIAGLALEDPSAPPPAVPEPSTMVIGTLFGIGGLMAKRRMKK
jgi:hypothetical protein